MEPEAGRKSYRIHYTEIVSDFTEREVLERLSKKFGPPRSINAARKHHDRLGLPVKMAEAGQCRYGCRDTLNPDGPGYSRHLVAIHSPQSADTGSPGNNRPDPPAGRFIGGKRPVTLRRFVCI